MLRGNTALTHSFLSFFLSFFTGVLVGGGGKEWGEGRGVLFSFFFGGDGGWWGGVMGGG